MVEKFHIVVEGKEDENFLKGYLVHLFDDALPPISIKDLKGKGNLGGHMPEVQQKLDSGIGISIIFDANSNYAKRKQDVKKILGNHASDLSLFFFPDNGSSGTLEDLLVKIIVPKHRGIFTCFENYKKCLNKSNYILPDMKGKVYSYKEAIGAIREPNKKDQFAPQYWDFNHSALEPLKKFLAGNLR